MQRLHEIMRDTDHWIELPTLLSKIVVLIIFESGHFIVGVLIYMKIRPIQADADTSELPISNTS